MRGEALRDEERECGERPCARAAKCAPSIPWRRLQVCPHQRPPPQDPDAQGVCSESLRPTLPSPPGPLPHLTSDLCFETGTPPWVVLPGEKSQESPIPSRSMNRKACARGTIRSTATLSRSWRMPQAQTDTER